MTDSRPSPKAHIAIVDDESITRKLLSSFLKREAYQLYEAATGQYLFEHIDEWRPDVILLDVLMPDMDGYAVCRKLRAMPQWRHIPIIMITALDRHEEMLKGLQVGADEFLTKPVSGLALSARVQSMIRIKRQYDELRSAIRFRDALVDTLVHDMRNSMSIATLKGQRILRRSTLAPAEHSALESIVQQMGHLNSFVSDLSTITQLETRKTRPDRTPVDFVALIAEIVEIHQSDAAARGQTIEMTVEAANHQAWVDRHLMERLFHRLLANAIKYSAKQSTIAVQIQETQIQSGGANAVAGTRLVLTDCAAHLSDEDKLHLIDDALALRNAGKGRPARFGLELALASGIVKAHGGRIWVEDHMPHGVRFCLEWPNKESA